MKVNNFDMLNMSKTYSSTGYQSVSSNLISNAEISTEKYRKSFQMPRRNFCRSPTMCCLSRKKYVDI